MIALIVGVALIVVLVPIVVWRLRVASRKLDAIMTEHHERMDRRDEDPGGLTPPEEPREWQTPLERRLPLTTSDDGER